MLTRLSPKEIVGKNVKEIRRKKGLSGVELAKLLFCSQQHVSRIERGEVRLSLEQIYDIADCLEVDIRELISGVGFQRAHSTKINKTMEYYQAEGILIAPNLLFE